MALGGKSSSTLEKLVPVLLLASIGLSFVVGVLWQRVNYLEGGTRVANTATTGPSAPPAAPSGKLTEEQAKKIPAVTSADHIRGSKDAKILLVEYSDLECPFCKRFHPTARQAFDEYNGQVAWVYRHFPLDMIHSQARPEAQASECANELGGNDGFWKFIDKIYEVTPSNNGLVLTDMPKYAGEVGLNTERFSECVAAEKYKDLVEQHYQGGVTAGVTGTPGTFIINNKGEAWLVPGAVPYDNLKQTIEEALKS